MGAAALLSIPLALLFTWTQVLPLDGIPALGTDYGQLVWNVWSASKSARATGNFLVGGERTPGRDEG